MRSSTKPLMPPPAERRFRLHRRAAFSQRAQVVIKEYLADHPESELQQMVAEGLITTERAYRTLIELARDPKIDILRPDVLPYVLRYEIAQQHQTGQPFTIGVFDLDDFKQINTELDHTGGDQVLQRAAEILTQSVWGDDVTRWGGEEFVVVFPHTTLDQAMVPSERMRRRFEGELRGLRPNGQPITISGGLTQYDPNQHGDWQALLKAGSQKVMAAKVAGKNRILA